MRNLTSLLERFSKILDKDSAVKERISEIIQKETGAQLPPKDISIKNHVLEITAGSAFKNEIRMKEERINASLKEEGIFVSRVLYR